MLSSDGVRDPLAPPQGPRPPRRAAEVLAAVAASSLTPSETRAATLVHLASCCGGIWGSSPQGTNATSPNYPAGGDRLAAGHEWGVGESAFGHRWPKGISAVTVRRGRIGKGLVSHRTGQAEQALSSGLVPVYKKKLSCILPPPGASVFLESISRPPSAPS
ncbi:hypothetical protein JX266_006258 [Neoarthrinium moseri]|nr:hypothetical protein JX266_006258 [Neoarthrinium moseri]